MSRRRTVSQSAQHTGRPGPARNSASRSTTSTRHRPVPRGCVLDGCRPRAPSRSRGTCGTGSSMRT